MIDLGWLTKDRQVGVSGKAVMPRLYIPIGVSGAFQHIWGIRGAQTIIAVNKDPEAPIFSVANYGVVDDLFAFTPVIITTVLGSPEKEHY